MSRRLSTLTDKQARQLRRTFRGLTALFRLLALVVLHRTSTCADLRANIVETIRDLQKCLKVLEAAEDGAQLPMFHDLPDPMERVPKGARGDQEPTPAQLREWF